MMSHEKGYGLNGLKKHELKPKHFEVHEKTRKDVSWTLATQNIVIEVEDSQLR
jgi:hypothetical protein